MNSWSPTSSAEPAGGESLAGPVAGWTIRGAWLTVTLIGLFWLTPLTRLRQWEVFAILVAPDKAIALAVGVVALSALGIGIARTGWRALIPVAVAGLFVACLYGGRVLSQGVADPLPARRGGLVVLSWNAQDTPPSDIVSAVAPVLHDRNVRVVILPETGSSAGQRVSAGLAELGWGNHYFGPEATGVLIRSDLAEAGGYELVPGNPPWAGLTVAPSTPSVGTPVVLAAHIIQPSLGNVDVRRKQLRWVRRTCRDNEFVLAVGDFNATLNHLPGDRLGACADVAVAQGAGAASTWPTWLPPWLGISIDRALVGPPLGREQAAVEILRGLDTAGADHWPILVTLIDS